SLVAFITVSDLFLVIYKGAVDNFQPVEYFLEGAAIYMGVSLAISGGIKLLERCVAPRRQPQAVQSKADGTVSYG
ncbi:MAG: hypothetical protein K0Q50_3097, partial [Vampirovibrio sp.]|nr:hypothetical protein [Vampirovibrio sp.]